MNAYPSSGFYVIPLAVLAASIAYVVAVEGYYRDGVGLPRPAAAVGAALIATGMLCHADAVVAMLLIPSAAAGIILILVWLLHLCIRLGIPARLQRMLHEIRDEANRLKRSDNPDRRHKQAHQRRDRS